MKIGKSNKDAFYLIIKKYDNEKYEIVKNGDKISDIYDLIKFYFDLKNPILMYNGNRLECQDEKTIGDYGIKRHGTIITGNHIIAVECDGNTEYIGLDNADLEYVRINELVELIFGNNIEYKNIYINGNEISDFDNTLQDLGVSNGTIISLEKFFDIKFPDFEQSINVTKFNTVSQVKIELGQNFNIDISNIALYYGDIELEDDKTLADYKIFNKVNLEISHKLKIFVRVNNDAIPIELSDHDGGFSTKKLKEKINIALKRKKTTRKSDMTLVFNGNVIEDEKDDIRDLGIQDTNEITLC